MRNTLNPVFSEKELEDQFSRIQGTYVRLDKAYSDEQRLIKEEVLSFKAAGGERKDWKISKNIEEKCVQRIALIIDIEESEDYFDKMIEANIAVLNGASIKETKKNLIEPRNHWYSFSEGTMELYWNDKLSTNMKSKIIEIYDKGRYVLLK